MINRELRELLPTLSEVVKLARLRWYGHVKRLGQNRIAKRTFESTSGNKDKS